MSQSPSNQPLDRRSQSARVSEDSPQNNDCFTSAFDAIPGFVWSAFPDGAVDFCNQAWLGYLGTSLDEARGKEFAVALNPEDKSDFLKKWEAASAQGRAFEAEARIRRADGCYRWFSVRAVPQRANGKIHRWYGANIDIEDLKRAHEEITERKLAEQRLLESERRFQMMADTAPVLIWMTGTDGLCNYFNKPWLEFTGRTIDQELGLGWLEGVYPDDRQGCFDGFLPAFHERKPFRMEYRLRRADGEFRWVIESGIPRYTGDGEFAGYIGSNIDITDLKRAAEERERLRQLQVELSHTNRVTTMGELAASIAHEIKQPISAAHTNARTCLRWLDRDQPSIDEAHEAASRIISDMTRASEIINRIRVLFKKGEPEREWVDVNEVIREMVSLLRSEALRRAVSIQSELAAELPNVRADRVQLQQVLMNLMLNGIDAIAETNVAGKLTVRSQPYPDEQVLISVSDTGVGLPSERADRVFEAFFTTKAQGTGMGLSISRSIIESHGGRLWAAQNGNTGATFQFTLPVGHAATAAA